jgi:multimeric flavodoxin WrbA
MAKDKLKALIVNCTLKSSPQQSNTDRLIDKAVELYQKEDVECEVLRLVDYNVKPGVSSNEGDGDEWPLIFNKIKECDILIIGSPIWVGHTPSTVQRLIERMDALFHETELQDSENGQYLTYNKVAGVLITGNEDGAHSVAAQVLWAMQEFGFTVPPNVNCYWVGEAGPGPSYIEAGGEKSVYTNKILRFTVSNTTWFAKMLKQNPIPTNLKNLSEKAEKESK